MIDFRKIIPAFLLSFSLACTSVFAGTPEKKPLGPSEENKYIPVQLLGINDFHGQIDVYQNINGRKAGGAEYLAAYIKKHEKDNKNTLLVHAGDVVGASSPVSSLLQDEPTIEILNEIGFDVGTVGNHEFDEGVDEMKRLINGGSHEVTGDFEGADFPYTVANVKDKITGEPILPPYVIERVNGIQIGFIGVVTTDTENIVLPSGIENVEFTDEGEAINEAAEELKEKGVKSIVVLGHVPASSNTDGTNPSGELAELAPEIDDEVDVIFGGHNHAYSNALVDGKLIVQSYSYGTAFSDVDLMIDPTTKDIVKKQAEIVTTYHDSITPDAKVKGMVDHYKEEVGPLINEIIGQTSEPITRKSDESGESPLGNLVADSQRAAMETDFAFMNPGGIRSDLDQGETTWGELYTMLPFGNNLVKMTLTGDQIKKLLEQQWNGETKRILQISGLKYTWDKSAPEGAKVLEITDSEGNPVDPQKQYTVTVNNYIATGGDGFTILKQGANQETGPLTLDAMIDYVENQGNPIEAPVTDRIQVKE
ncbi:bifunctional metallophosphatase/5'-nucleotidase [Pseudalkalibacillus salsuginis]|uniref:bifunctional metallophosphatase/5'-nucleotidase n=1 Tax=Pseudalkalibacillus salsuginis TaxID=2910972 RepID=UPI001F3F1710|nr:5'-nucleotidase C-terminal domain-containing protein [Pseudalkalibacillus salsuginis]MCF6409852.1 5'-nucleotidase C-terminal domain-containing protein [Pseudalkalibacillus salsuginis]